MPTIAEALAEANTKIRPKIDEALANDVLEKVRDIEIEAINDVVYGVYSPRDYKRRGRDGGMLDPENIVAEVDTETGRLMIRNITDPNTGGVSNFDRVTVAKDLPSLIELGHAEYTDKTGRPGYDFPGKGKGRYLKPRPFTNETIKRLRETDEHKEALKQGLRKLKLKVE